MKPVGVGTIFRVFFRIGLFTFGGGLAMLSVMRHELCVRRHWVDERDFWDEVTVATSFPGVIAVNTAFLQGRRMRGWKGSAAGVAGVVLPSIIVILLVVALAGGLLEYAMVQRFLAGAAAGVTALLTHTLLLFFRMIWRDIFSLAAAAVAGLVLFWLGWHPLIALLLATMLRMVLPMRTSAVRESEPGNA